MDWSHTGVPHPLMLAITQRLRLQLKYTEHWSNGSCDLVTGWIKQNAKMRCFVPTASHSQKARKVNTMTSDGSEDREKVDMSKFAKYFAADPGVS